MKKLSLLFLLFASFQLIAQTKGITYQAIIYNPSGEAIPGVNNTTAPMASKNICLQFSILDAISQLEYQETFTTTTDEFGMVNLVIGNGVQVGGSAANFDAITWSADQKSLKVALDVTGQCASFIAVSSQKLEYVPYAFHANSAENVSGIIPIENGGTNASTVLGAKTNLGLENVDNTSDLNKPISIATQAGLDLKENVANKSTVTTLGTSDVLFPSQNAVKTYVDASSTTLTTAINNEATIRATADATLTTNLATEVTNRTNADAVLTANLATEVTNRTNADATLTTNLATEVTDRTNADLLKENTANKSTATTLGTSNVLFPTQNAVKTYVDGSIASVNTANTALQTTVTALQNTVTTNATNTTASLALKENTANKSTTTTLGTSDVLFPTQNAVKTYVDGNIATVNAANTATQGTVTTLQNTVTTNATNTTASLALKENTANKSTTTTLGTSDVLFPTQNAVKTYVDGSITSANTLNTAAIAAVQADVDANETASNAADIVLQNNITTLGNTVTTNETNTTASLALKENTANKSTTTTLGTSDVLFPTQNAVKTYVDGSITSANTLNTAAIAAVQADVDANETASNAADVVLQNNITTLGNTVTTNETNTTASLALKENTANKSTTTTLGTSDVLFPTQNAVKTYVDNQVLNGTATNVSGVVAVANGGTGSATQNFVDLTNNQNVAGAKNFSSNISTNQVTVGSPATGSQNTMLGAVAFGYASPGDNNTALGFFTLASLNGGNDNTAVGTNAIRQGGAANGNRNTALGSAALSNGSAPSDNTAIGYSTLAAGLTGGSNTAVGSYAFQTNTSGSNNVGVGKNAGITNTTGSNNTLIGTDANVGANNLSNTTALGYGAVATASNTIQLGNASVTNVNTKGSITANAEISSEITANLTINNANSEQYKAKVLICNPTSQITITFSNDLPVGFNCMVLQKSADANKIVLAGGTGVTLKNRNNYTATAGNYAIATIVNIGGGIIVTAGDMQ
jgi:hypothetical protein